MSPNELRSTLEDHEKLSKSRSAYGARLVVESFHAKVEGRRQPSRPSETLPKRMRSDSSPPDVNTPVLRQTPEGINIHKCVYNARGIVETVCSSNNFRFDNPVFIVNPPLLVRDESGDLERVDGEGNTTRYTEDPERAMEQLLADLVVEEEPSPKKGGER